MIGLLLFVIGAKYMYSLFNNRIDKEYVRRIPIPAFGTASDEEWIERVIIPREDTISGDFELPIRSYDSGSYTDSISTTSFVTPRSTEADVDDDDDTMPAPRFVGPFLNHGQNGQ
jgi:hypothetical protein